MSTTLKDSLNTIGIDRQGDIPWIVRLLENPQSPVALPGKISLYNHDCLHILLERGLRPEDEALIVGFTMGNDPKTHWLHVTIFKFFSQYIYPPKFRLTKNHFFYFDLGFIYGRKLIENKQFNKIDFQEYESRNIEELRKLFGINKTDLDLITKIEQWLF